VFPPGYRHAVRPPLPALLLAAGAASGCAPKDLPPPPADGADSAGRAADSEPAADSEAPPVDSATEDTDPPPLEILDPRVEAVPYNALAARVTFNTSAPAAGRVDFGAAGGPPAWRVEGPADATTHDLLVIGLRPSAAYDLTIAAEAPDGRAAQAPAAFTAGSPPRPVVAATITAHDPERALDGWTLMNLQDNQDSPPTAAMYDMEGHPVWYYQYPEGRSRGGLDVGLTDRDTVTLGGTLAEGARPVEVALDGAIVWEGPPQPQEATTGEMHHHFERLGDGSYLLLEKAFVHGVRGDVLKIIDPEGDVLWSWSTWDHMSPPGDEEDWTHANWASVDGERAWLSLRNLSTVLQIDRASGAIGWALGAGGDFALASGGWFELQHAPSIVPGGLLIYDNYGGGAAGGYSRAVEYALDEAAWTADTAWSYDGAEDGRAWFTSGWGDADRLETGATLITAGGSSVDRVFEISTEGEVVWEMALPRDDDLQVSVYRAERIQPPGLLRLAP